ncbi:hypothetical protein HDU88_000765 [Geranomyces variabilis]|nr:hypothetical protein HDU88_000765 [Geranomyces variabilis]
MPYEVKCKFDVPQGTVYLRGNLPDSLVTETVVPPAGLFAPASRPLPPMFVPRGPPAPLERIHDVAPPSYRGNTTLLHKLANSGVYRREIRFTLDDGRLAVLSGTDRTFVRSAQHPRQLGSAEQIEVTNLFLEVHVVDEQGHAILLDGGVTSGVTLVFGDARGTVRPVSAHRQRQLQLGHGLFDWAAVGQIPIYRCA